MQAKPVEALAEDISQLIISKLDTDYPNAADTTRDAHPKTVALVKGRFTVSADLPENLRVGVFVKAGTSYPCYVRFSNADLLAKSDLEPDNRGCAIKLMSPEKQNQPLDQDFVMMNAPVNPLGTPEVFRDLIYYLQVSFFALIAVFAVKGNLPRFQKLLAARKVCDSVRAEKFYSTTPYALGEDQIVKYGLFPTSYERPSLPERVGFDYLTNELREHLKTKDATFDFLVQLRTVPDKMPMEDAGVEWDETLSPFVKVATLTIPAQEFDPTSAAYIENTQLLRFNVGHAWSEHKPLGRLNEVRAMVYTSKSPYS
jgi:hypothetical protein